MVCGVDSYRDSAKKGRSVGAFVASMNPTLTRYYSRSLFQSQEQELLDGLATCLRGEAGSVCVRVCVCVMASAIIFAAATAWLGGGGTGILVFRGNQAGWGRCGVGVGIKTHI